MVPLIEEISTRLSAAEVFERSSDEPNSFFLDSGMDPKRLGRYSFIGFDPFLIMKSRGTSISLFQDGQSSRQEGNPFDVLQALVQKYALSGLKTPVPFSGGAVGYLSYDLCHFIEKLPTRAVDDLQLPESNFGFYDAVLAFDHLENRNYIVSTGLPEMDEASRLLRARRRLEELRDKLFLVRLEISELKSGGQMQLLSNFSRREYLEVVNRIREYIAAGDVFQVNLSQRFEVDLNIPPYELYRRLRRINPAPFAAYLNFDDVKIAGASPERFLRLKDGWVETRPIKGTRPRGRDAAEDAALAGELTGSAKDRAENVMIVDLERNDLGRVCRYGTVRVPELAILESFPTVHHLTSTVTGQLRPGENGISLLKATFPGGSITGAPKVRAMEIIDELEPTRRSVYTGAMGYLGFDGNLDLNIVIRTFVVKEKRAYFQVGGGVIFDSDAEAEYVETLDKARALTQALGLSVEVGAG